MMRASHRHSAIKIGLKMTLYNSSVCTLNHQLGGWLHLSTAAKSTSMLTTPTHKYKQWWIRRANSACPAVFLSREGRGGFFNGCHVPSALYCFGLFRSNTPPYRVAGVIHRCDLSQGAMFFTFAPSGPAQTKALARNRGRNASRARKGSLAMGQRIPRTVDS